MGFGSTQNILHLEDEVPGAGFWIGVFVGRHAPDDAEAAGELLEALGRRPYQSGRPPKPRAEHSPVIKHKLRGQ